MLLSDAVVGVDAETFEKVGAQVGESAVGAVAGTLARYGDRSGDGSLVVDSLAERTQQQDPVGEVQSLLDVVGDEKDGCWLGGVDLQKQIVHAQSRERVKCTERLVEQQHAGVAGERSGEGGALRHTTGHFSRALVSSVLQTYQVQELAHALATGATGGTARQSQLYVLGDAAPRQ